MNNEEIIVHQYKLRMKGDYYRVCVTGSKYLAEKYMKEEFKADEIIWEKSYVTSKDIAIKLGKKNRIIANQGFFLKLQFVGQLATKQAKPLTEKVQKQENAKIVYEKFMNNEIATISLRILRQAKRISAKTMADDLSISERYINLIETNQRSTSIIAREMIANYLDVNSEDIDWGENEDNE